MRDRVQFQGVNPGHELLKNVIDYRVGVFLIVFLLLLNGVAVTKEGKHIHPASRAWNSRRSVKVHRCRYIYKAIIR